MACIGFTGHFGSISPGGYDVRFTRIDPTRVMSNYRVKIDYIWHNSGPRNYHSVYNDTS